MTDRPVQAQRLWPKQISGAVDRATAEPVRSNIRQLSGIGFTGVS